MEQKKKELPRVARRGVGNNSTDWVHFEPLRPGHLLPLLARPAAAGLDLAAWAREHRDLIHQRLHVHGAILFRGFGVQSAEQMNGFIQSVSTGALAYEERSSPRSQVSGNIYTSTDHPPSESIYLHNEQSYNLHFPRHLFFCCPLPAARGGATPLADSRRVYQRLPAEVRARFLEKGYLYVRNFGHRFGLSWQVAFQTEDRAVVEAYCRGNGIQFEWRGEGLRTRQVRRAAGLHPVTLEPVWFNHATFFHISALAPRVAQTLLEEFGESELPNNTYYGDGTSFEPHVLEALHSAYREELVSFPWEQGDLLMIDNMLAAHGREPFEGPRRVLAGMATPFPWEQVPPIPHAA